VPVFGVRHLSPAGAALLLERLDALQPTAVLVEGPADASDLLRQLVHPRTKPPVALLTYTRFQPVRSLFYPLAGYSPEWAAVSWAVAHKAEFRLIDLPAEVLLAQEKGEEASAELPTLGFDPWQAIARVAGEPDHETWWERRFEQAGDAETYFAASAELGRQLRELEPIDEQTLRREAHMRREIEAVLAAGHDPTRVAVVCGAFHAPVLTAENPAMSEAELRALPRTPVHLTAMPYSYRRLSSQSGYGAGNHAPLYFEELFDARRKANGRPVAETLLARLARVLRRNGNVRSTAEVIEAHRLACGLAAIAGGSGPALRDLVDAAVACLGHGHRDVIDSALPELTIGSTVGKLPPGISRSPLADDFEYQLGKLRLDTYRTDQHKHLELDLREDRSAETEEGALLDRRRSAFLHRLRLLEVGFAVPAQRRVKEFKVPEKGAVIPWAKEAESSMVAVQRDTQGTALEAWALRWRPDIGVKLAEVGLRGDSIEAVAALELHERAVNARAVGEIAAVVREAVTCQLPNALAEARLRLQALAVGANPLPELAGAVQALSDVIRYGSVRAVDPEPFRPLLAQLFTRGLIDLPGACSCTREAAPPLRKVLETFDEATRLHPDDLDVDAWRAELVRLAHADDAQPYLAGFALARLLSQGRLSEEGLAGEVSKRLSPGNNLDNAIGWFEGVLAGNRVALLSRLVFWRHLDALVANMSDEEFLAMLVPLRRAFTVLHAADVRRVVANLAELDRGDAHVLAEALLQPLSEDEAKKWNHLLEGLGLSWLSGV
jgi:hypothetical protein